VREVGSVETFIGFWNTAFTFGISVTSASAPPRYDVLRLLRALFGMNSCMDEIVFRPCARLCGERSSPPGQGSTLGDWRDPSSNAGFHPPCRPPETQLRFPRSRMISVSPSQLTCSFVHTPLRSKPPVVARKRNPPAPSDETSSDEKIVDHRTGPVQDESASHSAEVCMHV